MDARDYWNHYVEQVGGPAAVSAKLDVAYSTIAGICNGSRGIGHRLAERLAKADPLLDAGKLVWVRAIKDDHARRSGAAEVGAAPATEAVMKSAV